MSRMFSYWFQAIRPKTLPLAVLSILTGHALAAQTISISYSTLILTLLTAVLLQILSNLANDFGDTLKGTDNVERLGPKRVMQQGLISIRQMKQAIGITTGLVMVIGSALIQTSFDHQSEQYGFFFLGAFAILAALGYTLGNKPYGYYGFGDLSVLIFFGWLGVLGSDYLQTGTFTFQYILPATGIGLFAVAVLNMNNLRDHDNDKKHGKNTLVVQLGLTKAKIYHLFLISSGFISLGFFCIVEQKPIQSGLFLILLPYAIHLGKLVLKTDETIDFIPQMAKTIRLSMGVGILFCLGLLCTNERFNVALQTIIS